MKSSLKADQAFTFGIFVLLPHQQMLLRSGEPVRLGARSFEILQLLVERAGTLVTKRELMSYVWPNVFVEDANLKVHVSSLRRALGDTLPHASFIATVPGRGYRFVASVTAAAARLSAVPDTGPPLSAGLPDRSTLVGREEEIARITAELRDSPVVTLVGPGGVGKTTLAVEAAYRLRGSFEHGVCFVDASSTEDPLLIPLVLASALGLHGLTSDPVAMAAEHLSARNMLVVLDNCEHVLHAAALIAQRLAQSPMKAVLLATSREPLGIGQESVVRIEPFACPAELSGMQAALGNPSVALFALRAAEFSEYQLAEGDVPVVGKICEALDGLPLALELAAAMLTDRSPAELLASLDSQSALMHTAGSVRSRHVTLWSAFDWSYRLLSPDEATVFRLLSVFSGSFEPADVIALTKLTDFDAQATITALGQLVAKSLVHADAVEDNIRYRLLDSARSYAFGRLSDDPLYRPARTQHAARLLSLFEQAEKEWSWLETRAWRDRYDWRTGDLRKALNWCLGKGSEPTLGIDLTTAAIRLWNGQSAIDEQLHWVSRALSVGTAAGEPPNRLAKLAAARAWGMVLAGRLLDDADRMFVSAVDLAEQTGELLPQLAALFGHSVFLIYTGRNRLSLDRLVEFTELAEHQGDALASFDADRLAAMARIHLGEAPAVRQMLERQSALLSGGVPPSRITRYHAEREVSIRSNLALATWLTGEPDRAVALVEENIRVTEAVGQLMGQSNVLSLYALPIATWRADSEAVGRYCTILERNIAKENIAIWRAVHRFYSAYQCSLKGELDAAERMDKAVQAMIGQGLLVRTPLYMGLHAEALLREQRPRAAMQVIEAALLQAAHCEEPWCRPELLRIKGRVLSAHGRKLEAAAELLAGLQEAQTAGSLGFERRIAAELRAAGQSEVGAERSAASPSNLGSLVSPTLTLVCNS